MDLLAIVEHEVDNAGIQGRFDPVLCQNSALSK